MSSAEQGNEMLTYGAPRAEEMPSKMTGVGMRNLIRQRGLWPEMQLEDGPLEVSDPKYCIEGTDFSQLLKVTLPPGHTITAEPGTAVMMSGGVQMEVDIGAYSQGAIRVLFAGEHLHRLVLTNRTTQDQFVGISAKQPGKVIPIDLAKYSGIRYKAGAFLCADGKDWTIGISIIRNVPLALCGGQGFVINTLRGTGMAFIQGSGAIERLDLKDGEEVVVSQQALLAFEKTVRYDMRSTGMGTRLCCFGGMGIFNVLLTGPGMVLVQTMPMETFAGALVSKNRSHIY